MKALKYVLAAAVVLLLAGALMAPIGPIPGFFIGGTPAEVPEQWGDAASADEVRLKAPGALPRVVIIWFVEYDGTLHVIGSKESGWVRRVGDESPVEVRLGDSTYALTASRLREGWDPVLEAYRAKYETDYPDVVARFPESGATDSTFALFRLDPS